jgi:hypothetical protein
MPTADELANNVKTTLAAFVEALNAAADGGLKIDYDIERWPLRSFGDTAPTDRYSSKVRIYTETEITNG